MPHKKKLIDPPMGWRFGFPKEIPPNRESDVIEWLVEEGYPRKEIESFKDHFYYRVIHHS